MVVRLGWCSVTSHLLALVATLLALLLLILLILLWVHQVVVSLRDADEVSVESNNDGGPGDLHEDIEFLCVVDVSVLSWVIDSLIDDILLVEVLDVNEGPDGLEDHSQDHEDASGSQFSSS